jgi:hypothetical protein
VPHPAPTVIAWFKSTEHFGADQAYVYPAAVTSVVQDGAQYTVEVVVREHPLDAHMRQEVEKAQQVGGFVFDVFVLADESGHLKVCDDRTAAHP